MIAYGVGHIADLTSHVFQPDFQPRRVGKGRLLGAGVVLAQLLAAFLGSADVIMIFYGATLVFHILCCGVIFYDAATGDAAPLETSSKIERP